MELVHSLTMWNRAGSVLSGHWLETCNHLKELRRVLEGKKKKKDFDGGCCNDSPMLYVISKTVKDWRQYDVYDVQFRVIFNITESWMIN